MDWQPYINMGIGLMLGIGGWFARQVWDSMQQLKRDLKELEVSLPKEYVRKDELMHTLSRIEQTLSKLFDKLDGKADK